MKWFCISTFKFADKNIDSFLNKMVCKNKTIQFIRIYFKICFFFGTQCLSQNILLFWISLYYSHLSNKCGDWNKRRGGAKFAKSLTEKVGINVEGGILWKKLMHNPNKQGVEGGKNLRNQ